jgi:hypothetical protein
MMFVTFCLTLSMSRLSSLREKEGERERKREKERERESLYRPEGESRGG